MNRPQPGEYASYYGRYIKLVPDGEILEILTIQFENSKSILSGLSEDKALFRYTPGKWTIKEVVGHVIDTERVFGYRALCFARNEQTSLPGFDQDSYMEYTNFNDLSMNTLLSEYESVRKSNILMFQNFNSEMWNRMGKADGNNLTVRSITYIIAGHELHHLTVLNERYLT